MLSKTGANTCTTQVPPCMLKAEHHIQQKVFMKLFFMDSTLSVLPELADLPLIRLDFSCNKITEIPAAYRKLRQLQHIILDNNPMQSPPAQVREFIL